MSKHPKLLALLDKLQEVLERCYGESSSPCADFLSSTEPFCLDKLTPCQWLRWVFIVKFRSMVENNQPLPTHLNISAYFEETLEPSDKRQALLALIYHLEHSLEQSE